MTHLFAVAAWLAFGAAASGVVPLPVWPFRLDAHGDPLPPGAVARLGTVRCRHAGHAVASVQFSPDSRTVYSCSQNDIPHAWDVSTGRGVARFPGLLGCVRLRVSGDGRLLVGVRAQGLVVRDLRTGRDCAFAVPPLFGSCLAVAPTAGSSPSAPATSTRNGPPSSCATSPPGGWSRTSQRAHHLPGLHARRQDVDLRRPRLVVLLGRGQR